MIEKGKAVGGLLYQKLKNILSVGNILLNSQREKILKQISLPIDYVLELEEIGRASCRERVCQYV